MRRITAGLCLVLGMAWAAGNSAQAADIVRAAGETISGTIQQMTPAEVTIDQNGVERKVAANKVEWINYDGQPSLLRSVREALNNSRFQDAQASLENIRLDEVRRQVVRQEIEYLRAFVAAKLALEGNGSIDEAGGMMASFLQSAQQNYHYYDACRIVADLLMAKNDPVKAQSYYEQLASAPWPEYQIEAKVAMGWAQLAAGNVEAAETSFDEALEIAATSPGSDLYRVQAQIGKARCMAEQGQADDAIQTIQEILNRVDLADKAEILARAYNTLGIAHKQAGSPKDAVLAFLHVDLLYSQSAQAHIEALENLVQLWPQLQRPERAARAADDLRQRYGRQPPTQ